MERDEDYPVTVPAETFWDYNDIADVIQGYFGKRLWMRLKTDEHVYLEGEVALRDLFYHGHNGEISEVLESDTPVGSFKGNLVMILNDGPTIKIPGYNLVLHKMRDYEGFMIGSANLDFVTTEFEKIEDE